MDGQNFLNVLILILSASILALTITISDGLPDQEKKAPSMIAHNYAPINPANLPIRIAREKKIHSEKTFGAYTFKLDNGLIGIVIPNHRAPVVTHMVWYKAGAADETAGTSGIAHFMEHLMFKGSDTLSGKTLAPGEFSKVIRALGGQDNAFTSQDYTAYYQSAAASHLETLMDMEAGRMMGFAPPEAEVASERQVILEERRQRTDNDPGGRFSEYMMAALYPNHPYGTPIIGWAQEMAALTRQDALDFHEKYYAPNNAILVVAGDVEHKEVEIMARNIYGHVPPRPVPPRKRAQVPALDGRALITHESERVREPQWQRIFAVPSMHTHKDDALALEVAADILGGGPTSRLYKSLVIEQKLASSAGVYYGADGLDGSNFYISVTPLPGVGMNAIEKAVNAEITKLSANGPSADEVSESIQRLQDSAIYARDSLSGPAMIIGRALASGATLDDIEYWPALIGAVTPQSVQQATADYLSEDNAHYVTGHLLPKTAASGGGAL